MESLDGLSDVAAIRRLLDRAELEAVRNARRESRSWAEIATGLGVTRQSAWERWRDLDEEPDSPGLSATRRAETQLPPDAPTVPNVVGMSLPTAQYRLLDDYLLAVCANPELLLFLGPEPRTSPWSTGNPPPAAGHPKAADRMISAAPVPARRSARSPRR